MIKISKNCYLGPEITDLNELFDLAFNRQSVYMSHRLYVGDRIRPAAFVINQSLVVLSSYRFYKVIKRK